MNQVKDASSLRTVTLAQWLRRHLTASLWVAAVVTFSVMTAVAVHAVKQGRAGQVAALADVADLVSFAIKQKNRPLAELSLETLEWQSGARWAVVCEGSTIRVGSHGQRSACGKQTDRDGALSAFDRTLVAPVTGFSEYDVRASVPRFPLPVGAWAAMLALGLLLVSLLFWIVWIERRIRREVFDPIARLSPGSTEGVEEPSIQELSVLREKLSSAEALRTRQAVMKALVEQSQQVAHDIRSPLTALRVILPTVRHLPDEERDLISQAVDRIHAIAKGLLKANREYQAGVESGPRHRPAPVSPGSAAEIREVLESIVKEKTVWLEARDRGSDGAVSLRVSVAEDVAKYRLPVDTEDLRRCVSSLIDNAIEAPSPVFAQPGLRRSIQVKARCRPDSRIAIEVTDNGAGIPEQIRSRLGLERGLTSGKTEGSGLGLFHARQTAVAAGGDLEIVNLSGTRHGAQVSLVFSG